jgi:hypothetical protein
MTTATRSASATNDRITAKARSTTADVRRAPRPASER